MGLYPGHNVCRVLASDRVEFRPNVAVYFGSSVSIEGTVGVLCLKCLCVQVSSVY